MSEDQIHEIEMNITEAKKLVALGNCLDRLLSNRDFKKVIREEYLEKEAVRLVHLKGDPNMQSPESQAAIVRQMDAIGSFTGFLRKLEQQSYLAQKAIEDGEETLDSLRAEEEAE